MPSPKANAARRPAIRQSSRQGNRRVVSRPAPPQSERFSRESRHAAFYPWLILSFLLWVMYRQLFHFPVWFDETFGKAVFFGFPVWLYIAITQYEPIVRSFAASKMRAGLLLGVAIGGVYGFAASIINLLQTGASVQAAPLFASDQFWWEFVLAICTGFWETLFFFSWVMTVIQDKHRSWGLGRQVVAVALIFLTFHLPNTFLRFQGRDVAVQLMILGLFALGQALLFQRRRNAYALVLSQAIWGMVLLIHL